MFTHMIRVHFLLTVPLAAMLLICRPGIAAADVFDNLQAEPVSQFDFGIKRLRSAALQTSIRLSPPTDPRPQSQVYFDTEKRQIHLDYTIAAPGGKATLEACWERRGAAIKEAFYIGATAYSVPISLKQRVMRRFGAMFTREPVEKANAAQAMGERLSESTFVKMSLTVPGSETPIVCESQLNELKIK